MDAFFAAVEQRDHPEYRGKPVIVGGNPKSRGVVSTCSYEARRYGIHSAMSSAKALKLCPHAIFVNGNYAAYKEVSDTIRKIFYEFTDLVEPLSIDEAFLDVTRNKKNATSATFLAREIKKRILSATGLTASAGVSFNKFLAKVASDFEKPDGLTVITPAQADQFIDNLPIRKFYGVGKVTEQRMLNFGIKTGRDLKILSKDQLRIMFGKVGDYYFDIAHCLDNRPVIAQRGAASSIGNEITFPEDVLDKSELLYYLKRLAERVAMRINKSRQSGYTLTLKLKFFDFKRISRSITVSEPINNENTIMKYIPDLLDKTDAGKIKVRLVGITVSNFRTAPTVNKKNVEDIQLYLPFIFDE